MVLKSKNCLSQLELKDHSFFRCMCTNPLTTWVLISGLECNLHAIDALDMAELE